MLGVAFAGDIFFVAAVARMQAHPSALTRSSPNTTCLDLELYDRLGDGWNGANYSISTVDDGRAVVVAGGTLEDGFNRTDEVCVPPNTCYTINVSAPTPWWMRFGISWTLGNGTLSGGAPDHAEFFVSADDGEIFPGCTAPTPPPSSSKKMTLTPTAFSSSRRLYATASCFERNCVAYATFYTAAFANFIALAELTIDVGGNFRRGSSRKIAKIAINDDVAGTCGEARCTKSRCSSFNGTDVTAAARTGTLVISFTVSPDIVLPCGITGDDSSRFFLHADAWLDVALSETTSPTPAPTSTSPPTPLAAYSPRTLVATASCFTFNCDLNLTLDTSTFAYLVESAKLTISLSGNFHSPKTFAEIAIDGEEFGKCGNRSLIDRGSTAEHGKQVNKHSTGVLCVKPTICSNVNGTDVTVAARAGAVIISILVSPLVYPICGFDRHAVKAGATLVVNLSGTRYPTPLPTTSQRPTSVIDSSPRTFVATVTGTNSLVNATFDTSAFASSIAVAELTVDIAGTFGLPEYYVEIAVNGDDLGKCGEDLGSFHNCQQKKRCPNFDETDVTSAARTGMVVITFSASFLLGTDSCGLGRYGPQYSYQADVTLVVDFDESSLPTPFPTAAPPTASITTTPTAYALATFEDLQSAIQEEGTFAIKVQGRIVFQRQLDLVSVRNQQIYGSVGAELAIFDGGFNTSLFNLENTTLTLGAITLVNCWADVGGCVQARTSSLFLVGVRVSNCIANDYGGGFRLEDNSLLQAVNSTFDSNSATHGGVASLEASSRFEVVASSFTSNYARVGGVVILDASSFNSTGSSFQKNSADSSAGVAWITSSSNFTAVLSFFEANQGGKEGGGVIYSDAASCFSATNSQFRMNYASFRGGVAWIENNSTFEVTRSSFYGNSVLFSGAAVAAFSSSTFTAAESSFKNNTAVLFGGVAALQGSNFTARGSTFEGNQAIDYGGVVFLITGSSFAFVGSSFATNHAASLGGVALLADSTGTSTNCSYEKNHALIGGCFYVGKRSVVTAACSSFEENSASLRGGVVDAEVYSAFAATNSTFNLNSALIRGGAAFIYGGATLTATNSSFVKNDARLGGCAYIDAYSKFSARNSSFKANRAVDNGNLLLFTGAAVIELHNSTLQDHKSKLSTMIRCSGAGTAYAALLRLELSQRISLDANCVLFLYQLNNNGTEAFREVVIENGVVDPSAAAVNFVQWSYPCGQGRWSDDGIEHGQTDAYLDGNGLTINENDPFCTSEHARIQSERCLYRCLTCPAGTYLEFTLDRFAHTGIDACTECPAGKFLHDSTQRWWLHDDRGDCTKCPPGRFGNKPRSATCDVCQSGKYTAEAGSTACAFIDPGYFVEDAASEPEKCPPGKFSVGGRDSCEACDVGHFQPKSGQTQCLAAEPGSFVNGSGAGNSLPCLPGKFSLGQANSCSNCSNGTFASGHASTSCMPASPGYYVPGEGAAGETPCDPGRFSSDSGERTCTECEVGSFQPEPGQPACVPAEPGYFVAKSGATEQQPCAAGRFSLGANGTCEFCHIGEFQPDTGRASCIACPSPMRTTGVGRTYCDACIRSYFWNSLHWESNFDQDLVKNGTQCVDCCQRCEVVCDVDYGNSCVACDEDGSELATLNVKRRWWRKNKESTTVYECRLDRACRGGRSTSVSEQCFDGHFGCVFFPC